MFWSLSFHLMPDETVIEDSTKQQVSGFKATYSVFLTNKRVIFRFDGVGSSMAQSFLYSEILEAAPVKRLLVNYLSIKTPKKQYYLHTPDPPYWSRKIADARRQAGETPPCTPAATQISRKKQELASMLAELRQYELLSAEEVEQKKRKLETLSL